MIVDSIGQSTVLVDECAECFMLPEERAASDDSAWAAGLFLGGVAASVYVLWAWWSGGSSSALRALTTAAIVAVVLIALIGVLPQNGSIRAFFAGLFGVGFNDFKKHQERNRSCSESVCVNVTVADARGWTTTMPAWGETAEDASQAVRTLLRKTGSGQRKTIEVVKVEALGDTPTE